MIPPKKLMIILLLTLCPLLMQAQTNHLSDYINYSLEHSPLLKNYQNQLVIHRIDSMMMRAGYQPQVDISSYNHLSPIINGVGYDYAIYKKYHVSALMTVRQTIVGRENMKTQLKTFTLENQSVENAKRISEQELKLAVSTQYISAFGILEEVLFHEEMGNFLKKEEALLKTLTEKGVYKITDYLHFQVTLQQHQLFIAQQKAEYRNHIALLNGLCGIIDTSFVVLEKPEMMLRPALSFENTLQYFNFQIDSLKIQNSAAAIDYAYRPKLDLFADAGYRSTFALDPYKNFGASIGFAIAIPIYNGGQRQQQHSKLRVSEQIRKNDQDYSRQQYRQQLNQLSLQLEQVEKIILQAQSVVTSSKILMDAYNKQMQTGDASISDYLLALNNYLNAKHLITQHENHKLQIINQINYWNHE